MSLLGVKDPITGVLALDKIRRRGWMWGPGGQMLGRASRSLHRVFGHTVNLSKDVQ